jgi:hypothetical protein
LLASQRFFRLEARFRRVDSRTGDSADTLVLEGNFGNQFLHDATSTAADDDQRLRGTFAKIDNKLDITGRQDAPIPRHRRPRAVAGDLNKRLQSRCDRQAVRDLGTDSRSPPYAHAPRRNLGGRWAVYFY